MVSASNDELRRRFTRKRQDAPTGARLQNVQVATPDHDDDGTDVRVILVVSDAAHLELAEARHVRDAVRAPVAQADDRLPSVRFSEAA